MPDQAHTPEAHSLGAYIRRFFPGMMYAEHHDLLISKLMAVERGECKRLLISIPPRHGKSLIVSENFPPWMLGNHPDKQIVAATYGADLSRTFGRKIKAQFKSEEFAAIFPGCHLRGDSQASDRVETVEKGSYFATSVGAALTGRGADVLIIDDPVKDRQQAESQVQSDAIWEWYISTARTRLMPNGAIIVVQTRWKEDDLTGRILDNAKDGEWDYVCFPALTDEGEPLWPAFWPKEALMEIKRDVGSYEWNALYQNNPRPRDGSILTVRDIRYILERPPRYTRVIQIVDSAIKEKKENDWTVITTLGVLGNDIIHIATWRNKVAYPGLKKAVRLNYEAHKPSLIVVEDKASGQQLIQELSSELPIKAVGAVQDKVTRAGTLADVMSVGRICLVKGEEVNNDIISEMAAFPNGSNDDIVDTWAYGVQELVRSEILPMFRKLMDEDMVIETEVPIPRTWARFRAMCWSPGEPAAVLWWAVADDDFEYGGMFFDAGTVVVHRELFVSKPLTAEELSSRIKQNEVAIGWPSVRPGPAGGNGDVQIWNDKGAGPSITFNEAGVDFIRAHTDEKEGWEHIRSRLFNNAIAVNSNCEHLLNQLRHTVCDPKDKEKVEAGQMISAISALRFVCYSYKRMPSKKKELAISPYGPNAKIIHKQLGFK